MIEIFAVVLAVTGITALAHGRGANTVLTGVITVAGYVAMEFGLNFLLPKSENRPLIAMVAAWTWIALMFIFIRFAVGAGMPKPDSKLDKNEHAPDPCSCSYHCNQSAI